MKERNLRKHVKIKSHAPKDRNKDFLKCLPSSVPFIFSMPEPGVDTENEYANSKFSKRMLNTPTMRQQANERERERGGEILL